jgi:hypothetical protein
MSNDKRNMRASDHRRRGNGRPDRSKTAGPNRGRQNPAEARAAAKRHYERYIELARAAVSAGDPIEGENFYQHAEHYFRAMREHDAGRDEQSDTMA